MALFFKIISVLIALAMLLISGYAFVFVILALMPTIVAFAIDRRNSKAASNTIGAFNMVGLMPYLVELMQSGIEASAKAQLMLTNINVWFVVYGSASMGWILVWIVPQVTGSYFVYREDVKVKRYLKEQRELYEEWGAKVGFKRQFISKDNDD